MLESLLNGIADKYFWWVNSPPPNLNEDYNNGVRVNISSADNKTVVKKKTKNSIYKFNKKATKYENSK